MGAWFALKQEKVFLFQKYAAIKKIDGKTVYGLRLWGNADLVPRPDDIFQERLYCVRWVETYLDTNAKGTTAYVICQLITTTKYCVSTKDKVISVPVK